MPRTHWTYEVAPAGAPASGLEEYVVEDARGEYAGKVQTILERAEERFLAVERGAPPATHDVRLVPWSEVRDIDQDALAIRLAVDSVALDEFDQLDPSRGVENDEAELRRLPSLPSELLQPVEPGPNAGPTDAPTYSRAVIVGAVGLLSLLAVVVSLTARNDADWKVALFAVPAILLTIAGVLAYRAWREPYERRR